MKIKCFIKSELKSFKCLIKNMTTKNKVYCVLALLAIILLLKFFWLALVELIGWVILIGVCSGIAFLLLKFKKIFVKHK